MMTGVRGRKSRKDRETRGWIAHTAMAVVAAPFAAAAANPAVVMQASVNFQRYCRVGDCFLGSQFGRSQAAILE